MGPGPRHTPAIFLPARVMLHCSLPALPIRLLSSTQSPATCLAFSTGAAFGATGAGRGGAVLFRATAVNTASGPGCDIGATTRTGVPVFAPASEEAIFAGTGRAIGSVAVRG